MKTALEKAYTHAVHWLEGLNSRDVGNKLSGTSLKDRFSQALPEIGTDPSTIIDELAESAEPGLIASSGGRFFAWVIGGGLESALAADWLVSTWDQNAAIHSCSPAVAVVEEIAGRWMLDLLDLPQECSFAFTTGCQLAHMTSLAAARHAVLRDADWDAERDGLFGAPRITVLTSDNRHGSIERALRYLGIGLSAMHEVATDECGRMLLDALKTALDETSGPRILCLNAADLNVGAFDDFDSLIPLAKEHDCWVHVDGAFGLMARASRSKRPLLKGVEMADSWATDGHKWLNIPFDCGMAFVRDREAHAASMTQDASYITLQDGNRDQIDWNPEWSRRARGVPVYAALRELGRAGVESLIDRSCLYCEQIVSGIGALRDAHLVSAPTINQGLVRFSLPDMDPGAADTMTDTIIAKVNQSGEAFFSGTTWQGRRAMRVSVVNWRTTPKDAKRAIAAVERAIEHYRDEAALESARL